MKAALALIPTAVKAYILAGLLIAIATAIGGGYLKGRSDGATINEAAWQKREAQINADTASKITARETAVRAQERAAALEQAKASTAYQNQLKENLRAKEKALAEHVGRDAVRGLYVTTACPALGGSAAASPAAGAAGRDGGTGRQLLGEADSAFLIAEASRADAIVQQLAAAQAVIRSDRALCGVKE